MPAQPIARPRIGVLSFAHYHANFWCETFTGDPSVELAGNWDDEPTRGREVAARFGTGYEGDLDALLGTCDAVAICSETSRHAPLVEQASRAGCHILCEKPIAENVAVAQRIARAVRAAGVDFMQSFPKRFDPVSHELQRLVETGALGRVHLVRVRHGRYYGLAPDFADKWFVDPALSGGGALLDEGVHAADLLHWLIGMPESVVATISSAMLGLAVEDTSVAVFTSPGGLVGEITSSFLLQAADASIEIFGDAGTAIVAGVDLASRDITGSAFLKVYRAGEEPKRWEVSSLVPRFKLGEFHHQNAIAFATCLKEGTAPPMGLADGIGALAMIEAAYESARSGTRQQVGVAQDPELAG